MSEEKILITFSGEGDAQIEVQGVKGQKCLALTEDLEKALGQVKERRKKPEFHLQETAEEKLRQKR